LVEDSDATAGKVMSEAIVNLDNCAREPIHIPGSIQPHGVLMVLQEPALEIVQISENISDYLNVSVDDCLRKGLSAFLGEGQLSRLRLAFDTANPHESNPVQLQLESRKPGIRLDGVVHRHDGFCVLELEETEPPSTLYFRDFYKTVAKATSRLQLSSTLLEVMVAAAEEFRAIVGYDRVMIYRFAASGEGEVVAESKIDEADPYHGLWYPASDIPEQARRLYLLSPIRVIPQVPYQPVQLVPAINPVSGRPTDLTYANLRSVSPIHVEYLINMGVSASMSVSIVREGKLWGLVSCHHFSPRFVPFEMRNACVFLGQVLSGEITRREVEGEAAFSAKAIGMQAKLLEQMAAVANPLLGLVTASPNLLDLLPCSGAAVLTGDKFQAVGIAPGLDDTLNIVRSLRESRAPSTFHTRSLRNHYHASRDIMEVASGVIALQVSRDPQSYVLFFRPEVAQTVRWGGDPNKPALVAHDGFRLSPRKSFAVWKQLVEGTALPWTPNEIRVADELRKLIMAVTAKNHSIG
jgi:chemotaxis family two-component system sensor kinase Cph1